MKKILAMCLIAGSCAAFADQTGLYVGTGVGVNWNNQNAGNAATFRLDGGYNFTDYFGVELGTTGVTQNGAGLNQSFQFYDASLKGYLPLGSDAIELVGQVGGAYGSPGFPGNRGAATFANNTLQASWSLLLGAGIQYNVTRSLGLNIIDYNYVGAVNAAGYNNMLLAGIAYKF